MVCLRTIFLNTLYYEMNTIIWCYSKVKCSWYLIIVILYAKTSMRYAQIICFFFFFFCYYFSKANFKWSINTRKPFKMNVIKWKPKYQVILWTFIWHTIFFAVKESCHGNLVIDCWLPIKWSNVIPLLIESSVIVIFMWFFKCAMR